MDAPRKFPRDYYVCAEAIIPPSDYKQNWVEARINFTLKSSGKICISSVYKDKIETELDDLKVRAYMLLHIIALVYQKIGIWPDDELTKINFIKSDAGRPLLDVENSHSRIQFSMMKWVTPDWIEQPKVPAMAEYLAKLEKKDPITYHLFQKNRAYMLPESSRIKWEVNVF